MPNYNWLRLEIRKNMDCFKWQFDHLFEWSFNIEFEKENKRQFEDLKMQKSLIQSLEKDEKLMIGFLNKNVMKEYNFKEIRKALFTMFSFDEINLLDDEITDDVKREMEKERRVGMDEKPKSIKLKKENEKKKKKCAIF